MAADGDAWQDRGVCPDRSPLAHHRLRVLGQVLLAARHWIVGKGRVRTNEDVVLQANPIPELDATLHGDSIADHHIIFDEHVVADVAVRPDHRPGQDMRERPDAGSLADVGCLDNRVWVLKESTHRSLSRTGALVAESRSKVLCEATT